MKDTIINKSIYYHSIIQTSESLSKDLHGIHKEIIEYNKLQRQEKPAVSSDTVYTVKVTLFIFILGICIDRLLKFIDRKWKQAENKKFFIFHLTRANARLVVTLKDAYEKFHNETNIDTGLTSNPPQAVSSDFQRLLNINHEELFKAYGKKEVLSKIFGEIAFVDKVQKDVEKFHELVLIDSDKVRTDLETQSDEYLSLLSKYLEWEKHNNPRHANSGTFQLINSLVIKYYEELSGTRQLSVFYSDIIRTIQKHIVETGEYKTHTILQEIAERGRRLSHLISKLTAKTSEITVQYKVFSDYMDSSNKSLNQLIPQLK